GEPAVLAGASPPFIRVPSRRIACGYWTDPSRGRIRWMLTQEPNLAVGRIAADGALSITLSGAWTLRSGFPSAGPIAREIATRRPRSLVFDVRDLGALGQRPGHVPATPRRALRQPPGRDAPPPLGTYESRI